MSADMIYSIMAMIVPITCAALCFETTPAKTALAKPNATKSNPQGPRLSAAFVFRATGRTKHKRRVYGAT